MSDIPNIKYGLYTIKTWIIPLESIQFLCMCHNYSFSNQSSDQTWNLYLADNKMCRKRFPKTQPYLSRDQNIIYKLGWWAFVANKELHSNQPQHPNNQLATLLNSPWKHPQHTASCHRRTSDVLFRKPYQFKYVPIDHVREFSVMFSQNFEIHITLWYVLGLKEMSIQKKKTSTVILCQDIICVSCFVLLFCFLTVSFHIHILQFYHNSHSFWAKEEMITTWSFHKTPQFWNSSARQNPVDIQTREAVDEVRSESTVQWWTKYTDQVLE